MIQASFLLLSRSRAPGPRRLALLAAAAVGAAGGREGSGEIFPWFPVTGGGAARIASLKNLSDPQC